MHAPAPVQVRGHRDDLVLLVRNLLDNAIKYSPPGSRIDLGLTTPDGRASLTVDDQGPGIAPAERARVFDRFYRAEGNSQHGSGLGLAIARSIAEGHHASIVLEDTPGGQGLRARVDFPAA